MILRGSDHAVSEEIHSAVKSRLWEVVRKRKRNERDRNKKNGR